MSDFVKEKEAQVQEVSNEVEKVDLGAVDDDSQEDRIAWLRKRGVIIDMPEGNKNKNDSMGKNTSSTDKVKDIRAVTCVKISCDDSIPYELVKVNVDYNGDGDQFLIELKPHFIGNSNNTAINETLLNEMAAKQMGNHGISVSKDTIEKYVNLGSVESFSLSKPYLENDNIGVNVYLDEAGQLKNLCANRRATEFANLCGFQSVPFAGDVLIGRVQYTKQYGIRNIDFNLDDMDSNAKWLKGVFNRNYQQGIENQQVSLEQSKNIEKVHEGSEYNWRENEEDIEINFNFEKYVKSYKDLNIKFHRKKVIFSNKNTKMQIYEIELYKPIDVDDSTWNVSSDSKNIIDITLTKAEEGIWNQLTV